MISEKDILQNGNIHIEGLIPDSSNGALKVEIDFKNHKKIAILKPQVTIKPLWDFPDKDLNKRELATFLLSEQLSLNVVPTTVLREVEGIGECLIQNWIDEIANEFVIVKAPNEIPSNYLKILNGYDELNTLIALAHVDSRDLRNLCLFDLIINNADRKGSHLLQDSKNRLWAIDHGVTWHKENKIRTILWGWIGKNFDEEDENLLKKSLEVLQNWQIEKLQILPSEDLKAAIVRIENLLEIGMFPQPSGDWPAVPWPIF